MDIRSAKAARLWRQPSRELPGIGHAGRILGFLFAMSGVFTMFTVLMPTPAGFHRAGVLAVGLLALVLGAVDLMLPWERLPRWLALVQIPVSYVLIAVHNLLGGVDPFRYGMFYVVAFMWVGLTQPRGLSLLCAPLAAATYVVPLIMTDARPSDYASLTYAIPLYILVGEVLAYNASRLRSMEVRLRHLATHDTLTGLANRGAFDGALAACCASGTDTAVIFVDLDDFKAVNDRYGHAAGDRLLIDVARALTETATRPGDMICRLAGDEFVVLVTEPDARRAAPALADRIAARLSGLRGPDGGPLSASIGVAIGAGMAPTELLASADSAMYEAKHGGKGRVVRAASQPDAA
ncbi:GGDEF domain-containing protein [Spirillospora albida]|uniref:GGDEF domain-containing protein n=1 Tax=Spirillospora albida TaxID=58123 RepID=UPI00068B5A0D|nr:GGDEF domain-containing protein [Spirillospora albida]